MYTRKEGYFSGFGDAKLHFQTWTPEVYKAHLVITHGQGEHSESYQRLAQALENMQVKIWAWDWRGHGKSEGARGYASHFSDYLHDYELFLELVVAKLEEKPLILLGHSMGGLIQLRSILDHQNWKIRAQVLSAPLLGLSVKVPVIKEIGARVLYQLLPKVTLGNEIADEALTQDPAVLAEFKRDSLRHTKISSGVYLGSLESIEYVHLRADKIKVPTLLQVPQVDPVVSTPRALEFFEKMSSKQKLVKVYHDGKHEIYNDIVREKAYKDLIEFISSILQ